MATEKEPLITNDMENELSTMGSGLTHEEEEELNRKAKEQEAK